MIPNNQTVGTSTDCTTLFYGVWSNLKVGMSNQVEFFIDPDLFEKASSLIEMHGDGAPQGTAMINTLLSAMPDDVKSHFLIDRFNNLYS